jgi:hypothetical protein
MKQLSVNRGQWLTSCPAVFIIRNHGVSALRNLDELHAANAVTVSLATPVISGQPQAQSAHTTARSGMCITRNASEKNPMSLTYGLSPDLSRRAARPPTPVSVASASISSAPAAATASSAPCVSTPAISHGAARPSHARPASSASPSILPTTSSCAQTP